jgi:hypothetical protein
LSFVFVSRKSDVETEGDAPDLSGWSGASAAASFPRQGMDCHRDEAGVRMARYRIGVDLGTSRPEAVVVQPRLGS